MARMLDGSDDLEAALKRLYGDIGVPLRFRDVGVKEEDIELLVEDIFACMHATGLAYESFTLDEEAGYPVDERLLLIPMVSARAQ